MKVYIAGKMTGEENYRDKFLDAERQLREDGHTPMHSAGLPEGFEHSEYMHICRAMIDVCEAVYLLPDWKDSKGALMEREYAQERGIPAIEAKPRRDFAGQVVEMFNKTCASLPKVKKLTVGRRRAIRLRGTNIEEFREVFEKAEQSDFLTGQNDRGWTADFDWILKPANWTKIQEGVYNQKKKSAGGFNDHPQRKYTEEELARLFVDLG